MFVCICNAITDHEIEQAKLNGVCTEQELFESMNTSKQCGQCLPEIRKCLLTTNHEQAALTGNHLNQISL